MKHSIPKKLDKFSQWHVDLAFGFSAYTVQHLECALLENLPYDTSIFFLTDNPEFNHWEMQFAVDSQKSDDVPDRIITLIYIPIAAPVAEDKVPWDRARIMATFSLQPRPSLAAAG